MRKRAEESGDDERAGAMMAMMAGAMVAKTQRLRRKTFATHLFMRIRLVAFVGGSYSGERRKGGAEESETMVAEAMVAMRKRGRKRAGESGGDGGDDGGGDERAGGSGGGILPHHKLTSYLY